MCRGKRGKEISIDINSKGIVYLYSEQASEFKNVSVVDKANGITNNIEMYKWLNGILELGTYENTTVDIKIDADVESEKVYCAILPLKDFEDNVPVYANNTMANFGNNSFKLSMDVLEKDNFLFLPIYADKGWKCTVNGEHVKIKNVLGYCMAIPVERGHNEIQLIFYPVGLKTGILLTCIGIVLGVFLFIRRGAGMRMELFNSAVLWCIVECIYALLLIVFYIIPVIYFILFIIKTLL